MSCIQLQGGELVTRESWYRFVTEESFVHIVQFRAEALCQQFACFLAARKMVMSKS